MQRDMDLCRAILLKLEQDQEPNQGQGKIDVEGYSAALISYNIKMLSQAEYVEALDMSGFNDSDWRAMSLTWKGHEFLDATRDNGIWRKVKAELKDRATSAPFALIQQLAMKYVAAQLGLPGV